MLRLSKGYNNFNILDHTLRRTKPAKRVVRFWL